MVLQVLSNPCSCSYKADTSRAALCIRSAQWGRGRYKAVRQGHHMARRAVEAPAQGRPWTPNSEERVAEAVYPEEEGGWEEELQTEEEDAERAVRPAYNKYRSPTDISRDYIKQWKRTTRREEELKPMTILTLLFFIPGFIKYYVIPQPVRYLWYLVWIRIMDARHAAHRWACVQGARFDCYLMQRAGRPPTIPRALVLRRYHHKESVWATLAFRLNLLKAALQPQRSGTVRQEALVSGVAVVDGTA